MPAAKGSRFAILLTPVRMILPGVIVSLIGASLGYYLFNNPKKIRGRATHAAWGVIKEYEQLYQDNVDLSSCTSTRTQEGIDNTRFFKDLLHQQEVMVANLGTVKQEKDIDSKLVSLINIKTAGYQELQQLTQKFLDTLRGIDKMMQAGSFYSSEEYMNVMRKAQMDFFVEKDYIQGRDSVTTNRLLAQLRSTYKLSFAPQEQELSLKDLPQLIQGNWQISGLPVAVAIRNSGRGTWKEKNGDSKDFAWSITEGNILSLRFDDANAGGTIKWMILRCTEKILSFYDLQDDVALAACR